MTGASQAEGRFEAQAVGGLTPFVGREAEIQLLLDRWRQAKDGEGQVVLLSGEPGIGKSRITQVLRERLEEEAHVHLRYQCSPFYTNSAFYPIIGQLERAAGFARDDTAAMKLDKLERVIRGGDDSSRPSATPPPQPSPARGEGEDAATDKKPPPPRRGRDGEGVPLQKSEAVTRQDDAKTLALFASLLSLPVGRYSPLNLSPQRQKDDTIAALAARVTGLAQQRPLLMLFEDAHWCDPTTLEVLTAVIGQIEAAVVTGLGTGQRRSGTHCLSRDVGGWSNIPGYVLED